jgi:mannuronan 5-epimerase
VNIVITSITKISTIFSVFVLFVGMLNIMISPSSFIIGEVQAQKVEEEEEKEKCISYNKSENLISITCDYADFADVTKQIEDPSILKSDTPTLTNNTANTFNVDNNNEKAWLLDAGLKVAENANLDINSNDVTWLKIIPNKNSPNAIEVDGSLKVNSVKITSWNSQTNDYVYFSDAVKHDELEYKKEIRPYIKVNTGATGPFLN